MLNEEWKQQESNDVLNQKVDIVFQFNYFTVVILLIFTISMQLWIMHQSFVTRC